MLVLKRVLEKDVVWMIKLILIHLGILTICGLIYIGRYLS